VEITTIEPDEVAEFHQTLARAFHGEWSREAVENASRVTEPARSLVVRDGGRMVASTGSYTRRLTVPGGEVPLAGVTMVGVQASHRRRGLLRSLMRHQLDALHEAGEEPVAALWAAETAIYTRFGYGMATMAAKLEVHSRQARLRSAPGRRADLLTPAEAVPAMRRIHDAVRAGWPGMLDRPGAWWEWRIADPEERRDGAGVLRAAVIEDAAYALYAVKEGWDQGRPAYEVFVRELVATDADAHAAIWGYLLGLDLTHRLEYELGPADDPLVHMVTEAQAVQAQLGEGLWVRLVDVPAALSRRAYAAPFEVVLDVADEFCAWNAGRWALAWDGAVATCERTSAPADLELGCEELGAAYLGGTTLDGLARAGRVRELRAGALGAASRAFRGERAPWCPEIF
jgi:predicted acetyltransferase